MTAAVLDVNNPASANSVGGELAADTTALVTQYADTRIVDLAGLERVVLERQALGDAMQRVEQFFGPLKSMAHRLHKALCDREGAILKPLQALDRQKVTAISDFKAAQDRIRQEREREEQAARKRESDARAAAEAAALETQGHAELAEAVLAEAITAPPPVVALPDITKTVEGLRFTRTWHWRYSGGPRDVTQTPPEIRARTMRLLPREYLTVDERKLTKFATGMKDTATIPGIDFFYVDTPRR